MHMKITNLKIHLFLSTLRDQRLQNRKENKKVMKNKGSRLVSKSKKEMKRLRESKNRSGRNRLS